MSWPPATLPARLLVVTDRHQARQPLALLVDEVLAAGARWIWLRDKDLPAAARRALARDLADRIAAQGGTLTIGAEVGLAAELRAGVHLGARDDIGAARRRLGARALIGVSAHGPADIEAARAGGADYATLSPIFASASKPGYGPALGVAALRVGSASGFPVVALGGITAAQARACRDAGAAALAVMGPVMRRGGQAVDEFQWALRDG